MLFSEEMADGLEQEKLIDVNQQLFKFECRPKV